MSIEHYSFSKLNNLKVQYGVRIDSSGTSSAYIWESKLKRLITKAYKENPDFAMLFCGLRNTKNGLPYTVCYDRLEKCEDWQLALILETAEDHGIEEGIKRMFSLRKADKHKILRAREKEEARAEKYFDDEAGDLKFN